jgi:hypothetical protein
MSCTLVESSDTVTITTQQSCGILHIYMFIISYLQISMLITISHTALICIKRSEKLHHYTIAWGFL